MREDSRGFRSRRSRLLGCLLEEPALSGRLEGNLSRTPQHQACTSDPSDPQPGASCDILDTTCHSGDYHDAEHHVWGQTSGKDHQEPSRKSHFLRITWDSSNNNKRQSFALRVKFKKANQGFYSRKNNDLNKRVNLKDKKIIVVKTTD